MKINDMAQIQEHWMQRQTEMAATWFELLDTLSPRTFKREKVLVQLTEATETLIQQMVADVFEPEKVRAVGRALEALDNLQPESMVKITEYLAAQFTQGLSPDQIAEVHPRLSTLLATLAAGFFMGKAERAKQFGMSAMSKMGHDLKTPINAVTGFSRVILKGIDGPITEFQQQDLTSIYEAGQKLLTMINDLFETAKSDAARTNIYTRSFDVSDLLGDILRTAQPILARQENTLSVAGVADLGTMSGGASEVRWILLSLLLYIGRFFEKGSLTLTANRRKVEGVERLFFEIQGLVPEGTTLPFEDGHLEGLDEVGLMVSNQFCKDMGGGYSIVREGNVIVSTLWLPARIPTQERSF